MHNVIDYEAARKRRKKGEFEMARKEVRTRIGNDKNLAVSRKYVGALLTCYFNRRYYSLTGVLKAWPGIPRLAGESGLSESTVRRSLRDLEKAGHLAIILSGGGRPESTNRYIATPGSYVTPDTEQEGKIIDLSEEKASRQSDTSRHEQARTYRGKKD